MRCCLLALAVAAGCNTTTPPPSGNGLDPDEIPLQIDQRCPGDPACPDQGDGLLYVGAAKRDVTPLVEPFVDTNGDAVHEAGEPFTDLNGNGQFDPVWLAGRSNGRLAFGVHDPIWVRCYVLRQNQTTLANCAVDAIGYFQDEEQQIRADLDPALGVDLLMMSATHDHQSQDTTGLWGPDETTTGYDPGFMKSLRVATVEAVTEAVGALKPAAMSIGQLLTEDPNRDMTHYVADTRDPVIIDDRLHLMQFDGSDGKPIVTVINWAAHPDNLGSFGHYISSDFVHYLRESVEAGTGSMVVFVNGAQGGQIGGGGVKPLAEDGTVVSNDHSYHFVEAWGDEIARLSLQAFDAREMVPSPKLAFRHTTFPVHVENVTYLTAGLIGLLHKPFYGYDPTQPLMRTPELDNSPLTTTEIAYITLGPASIITCPGELLPELFVGGYDGSHSGLYTIVDTTKPNAADLTQAPKPPYLIDRMVDGPVEHRMVFGLTLDFLGYIVPRYNFVLDADSPYLARAPGDHYEETNSIGPRAEPELVGTMRQLVLSAQKGNQ
jgi:hypothetical protein